MKVSRRKATPSRWLPTLGAVVAGAFAVSGCGGSDSGTPNQATRSTGPDDAGSESPVVLGRLEDRALRESSGLVASRRNPGVLWTHNDAGDGPNLYCVTREAIRCGTWRVTNAEAQDWEDIATGPGPVAGERYLYIGDIGDNDDARAEVVVYRLVEPMASPTGAEPTPTAPAEALRLRYDDGPRDAEALLVHPVSGDVFVVTKDRKDAGVYKASSGATVLTRIADLSLGGDEVVTGADISPDGTRVALVTKARAHELRFQEPGSDFDGIWRQPLRPIEIPAREQGEAIAYRLDGRALLTTSEGSPMPLHEVTLTPAASGRG